MLNIDFLEKGQEIVSPPHFVYDLVRKVFLKFYSINRLVSLPDCPYFLRY